MNKLLVTGGAGFIGSNFVDLALSQNCQVTVLDALTYAGSLENLRAASANPQFKFVEGRIEDRQLVKSILEKDKITAVLNFAAESHVDNSISGPGQFITTNVVGTFELLEACREYWSLGRLTDFRFLHVSTDEVFGALGATGKFTEETAYAPNSPYSASKAGSDFLVRAWYHTYGLPTIITNCSNNYGPRQFPEKLIPRMITQAIGNRPLPVYGKGLNVRDWIHVEDHCRGILLALMKGKVGESYCFGGSAERRNIDVVERICDFLDMRQKPTKSFRNLITFVEDRLGHDFRYAIDDNKAKTQLGYSLRYTSFEEGLSATIDWYLKNEEWLSKVQKSKN